MTFIFPSPCQTSCFLGSWTEALWEIGPSQDTNEASLMKKPVDSESVYEDEVGETES
jgi:hypothetical protein